MGGEVTAAELRPAEAEAEWDTCWTILPCLPTPALTPSVKVQAYMRMFLLSELASPVGNATGIREEKDTWRKIKNSCEYFLSVLTLKST